MLQHSSPDPFWLLRQAWSLDVLFVGPPGVGKSHLAQAIGIEAIKAGFLVHLKRGQDLNIEVCPLI